MSLKHILLISASLLFAPLTAHAQSASEPASAVSPTAATSPAVTTTTTTVTTTPAATAVATKTEAPKTNPTSPVTHAEFEALLKDTLLNNPEIIMEAVKKLRDKHMEQANKDMQESLEKHKEELVTDPVSPRAGNIKDPDLTIIEFFDYHCGYCKHMLPVITQLLHDDKKVRIIFREFPILAEDSVLASRAAIAVYNIAPEKYFDFHTELMKSNGKFDEKTLAEMAKKVGVDSKKMKKEMGNAEITHELDGTRAVAEDMGIRGTPALIIGGELLPGAVPYDDLVKVVENARKGETGVAHTSKPEASAEPAPPKPMGAPKKENNLGQ